MNIVNERAFYEKELRMKEEGCLCSEKKIGNDKKKQEERHSVKHAENRQQGNENKTRNRNGK